MNGKTIPPEANVPIITDTRNKAKGAFDILSDWWWKTPGQKGPGVNIPPSATPWKNPTLLTPGGRIPTKAFPAQSGGAMKALPAPGGKGVVKALPAPGGTGSGSLAQAMELVRREMFPPVKALPWGGGSPGTALTVAQKMGLWKTPLDSLRKFILQGNPARMLQLPLSVAPILDKYGIKYTPVMNGPSTGMVKLSSEAARQLQKVAENAKTGVRKGQPGNKGTPVHPGQPVKPAAAGVGLKPGVPATVTGVPQTPGITEGSGRPGIPAKSPGRIVTPEVTSGKPGTKSEPAVVQVRQGEPGAPGAPAAPGKAPVRYPGSIEQPGLPPPDNQAAVPAPTTPGRTGAPAGPIVTPLQPPMQGPQPIQGPGRPGSFVSDASPGAPGSTPATVPGVIEVWLKRPPSPRLIQTLEQGGFRYSSKQGVFRAIYGDTSLKAAQQAHAQGAVVKSQRWVASETIQEPFAGKSNSSQAMSPRFGQPNSPESMESFDNVNNPGVVGNSGITNSSGRANPQPGNRPAGAHSQSSNSSDIQNLIEAYLAGELDLYPDRVPGDLLRRVDPGPDLAQPRIVTTDALPRTPDTKIIQYGAKKSEIMNVKNTMAMIHDNLLPNVSEFHFSWCQFYRPSGSGTIWGFYSPNRNSIFIPRCPSVSQDGTPIMRTDDEISSTILHECGHAYHNTVLRNNPTRWKAIENAYYVIKRNPVVIHCAEIAPRQFRLYNVDEFFADSYRLFVQNRDKMENIDRALSARGYSISITQIFDDIIQGR